MCKKTMVIQIPADEILTKNIRNLAEMDERSVATYCKRVLQKHIEDVLGINTRELKIQDLKKEYIEKLSAEADTDIALEVKEESLACETVSNKITLESTNRVALANNNKKTKTKKLATMTDV